MMDKQHLIARCREQIAPLMWTTGSDEKIVYETVNYMSGREYSMQKIKRVSTRDLVIYASDIQQRNEPAATNARAGVLEHMRESGQIHSVIGQPDIYVTDAGIEKQRGKCRVYIGVHRLLLWLENFGHTDIDVIYKQNMSERDIVDAQQTE